MNEYVSCYSQITHAKWPQILGCTHSRRSRARERTTHLINDERCSSTPPSPAAHDRHSRLQPDRRSERWAFAHASPESGSIRWPMCERSSEWKQAKCKQFLVSSALLSIFARLSFIHSFSARSNLLSRPASTGRPDFQIRSPHFAFSHSPPALSINECVREAAGGVRVKRERESIFVNERSSRL